MSGSIVSAFGGSIIFGKISFESDRKAKRAM